MAKQQHSWWTLWQRYIQILVWMLVSGLRVIFSLDLCKITNIIRISVIFGCSPVISKRECIAYSILNYMVSQYSKSHRSFCWEEKVVRAFPIIFNASLFVCKTNLQKKIFLNKKKNRNNKGSSLFILYSQNPP